MDIEAIETVVSEVPTELRQQINDKFQTATQTYKEYSSGKKEFVDCLKTIDELYKVLFPFFVKTDYDPYSNDMGELLKVWTLTRKAIEKTVSNNIKQPADLKSYIRNLSMVLKCDIRFYKENYERKKT